MIIYKSNPRLHKTWLVNNGLLLVCQPIEKLKKRGFHGNFTDNKSLYLTNVCATGHNSFYICITVATLIKLKLVIASKCSTLFAFYLHTIRLTQFAKNKPQTLCKLLDDQNIFVGAYLMPFLSLRFHCIKQYIKRYS